MTNPIVTTEQQMRELLQPMLKDAQMKSWREGCRDGLTMASRMAERVRNDCAVKVGEARNDCERAELEAQIAALGGLVSALNTAAAQAVET